MVSATQLEHVARSDCERIRPGLIAQPSNTVSSLAYVAVGVWAVPDDLPVGLSALLAGAGSVAYHGPGGRVGHVAHDVGVVALATVWALRLARPGRRPRSRRWSLLAMALGIGAHASSRTDRPLCRPESPLQGHACWHVLSAVAVALAASRGDGAMGAR